jgi:hypothetical protein
MPTITAAASCAVVCVFGAMHIRARRPAPMTIVIESAVAAHAPELYQDTPGAAVAKECDVDTGFDAMSASCVRAFAEHGYLVIRKGLSEGEVRRARDELEGMLSADDPKCSSVYFEAGIRAKLAAAQARQDDGAAEGSTAAASGAAKPSLALGSVLDALPALPGAERAEHVRKFMGFAQAERAADHPALFHTAHKPGLLRAVAMLLGAPCASPASSGAEGLPGPSPRRLEDGSGSGVVLTDHLKEGTQDPKDTAVNSNIELFQDMAMIKPPGGREKPFHQDHAYFNHRGAVLGVWVALGRAARANGCMVVNPGGHRGGPRAHFQRRDWQLCDADALGLERVRATRCERVGRVNACVRVGG